MDYPYYLAQGWQIGSGPIESACKTVVGQHLKLAGMRWCAYGTNNVCHLRALFKSKQAQWDAFWERKVKWRSIVYQRITRSHEGKQAMADSLQDQVLGCVLGGAVGDALGSPFEGLWSDCIPERDQLLDDFAEFEGYPRGQYTDDTQLTIATVESVVRLGRIDPADIARSIARLWKTQAVVGPGGACTFAADQLLAGGGLAGIRCPGWTGWEWDGHADGSSRSVFSPQSQRIACCGRGRFPDHAPGSAQCRWWRGHRLDGSDSGAIAGG